MALTKIKGQNFRAFLGGLSSANAFVEETNCQVQISGNMEDGSTKDDVNAWTKETMTSKQWQVQVTQLEATATRLKSIITQFNSDSTVSVGFDQTTANNGQNRTPANASFARSGQAHLTDVSISAPNRQNIEVSLTYQGTGALA